MIRIYVANLAKYNEGRLVGEWIDLPMDGDELKETLDRIAGKTDTRDGDELAIHDYEGPYRVGEYESISKLNELAEAIEDSDEGEDIIDAILRTVDNYDIDALMNVIRDRDYMVYTGVESMADVAAEMIDDGLFGEVPKNLVNYIDYEMIGRDLEIGDGWVFYRDLRIAIQID